MSKVRIALIYGSAREGRCCDRIANWAAGEIERQGIFRLDLIDPRDYDLPEPGRDNAAARALRQRLDRAEAFVVVTPEYNHGYPAALKALIDAAYREWQAKPVAFVSYGGASGGLRAVEQLRQVFAELHTVTLRDAIGFSHPQTLFDERGQLKDDVAPQRRMASMLAHLDWWAIALRDARGQSPYGEVGQQPA